MKLACISIIFKANTYLVERMGEAHPISQLCPISKKVNGLENEHSRPFSSVEEVTAGSIPACWRCFERSSKSDQTAVPVAGVQISLGYRIPTPTPTPSKPVIIPRGFWNPWQSLCIRAYGTVREAYMSSRPVLSSVDAFSLWRLLSRWSIRAWWVWIWSAWARYDVVVAWFMLFR